MTYLSIYSYLGLKETIQVSNLSDCIKVACDFVTVSSVNVCLELRQQFRAERREDVLQLPTMLWYSWLSVTDWAESPAQADVIEPITRVKEFDDPMVRCMKSNRQVLVTHSIS